jgi:hypothetical protein
MCAGKVDDSNSHISNGVDVTYSNGIESHSSNTSTATAAAWRKQLVAVTDDHNFRVLSLDKVCYVMLSYTMSCYIILNTYDMLAAANAYAKLVLAMMCMCVMYHRHVGVVHDVVLTRALVLLSCCVLCVVFIYLYRGYTLLS